jgi:hypothetical protein
MTNDDDEQQPDQQQEETAARLIAEAQQQVRLPALWGKLHEALEREAFTGPIRGARYAGERAAAIARTAPERDHVPARQVASRIGAGSACGHPLFCPFIGAVREVSAWT